MPGRLLANLRRVSRVVGGMTPDIATAMVALYRHVVQADLDPADYLTAELVKTAENTYRDVQIAFANEMALICQALGGDVWRVRELVNKTPERQMHRPGAGVGGHCIPKDPWLLIANLPSEVRPQLIPTARVVNDGMPRHLRDLTANALQEAGVDIDSARVVVLGYAYLENSGDIRNSPGVALVEELRQTVAEVRIHDPYVADYGGDLQVLATDADALILTVAHDSYGVLDLDAMQERMRTPVLIDGRNVFSPEDVTAAGWRYHGVGRGRTAVSLRH
jgi:UDP-N-acetyl-D-mannosaminuronic acid dehydrogenase